MAFNQFWRLLGKKLSGEASQEEIQELELLMKLHPDWLYAAEHLNDLWKQKQPQDNVRARKAFLRHLQQMKGKGVELPQYTASHINQPRSRREKKPSVTLIGLGAFSLLLIAGILLQRVHTGSSALRAQKKFSEIVTHAGSRTNLTLPDGSLVWLNAGSKLTYADHFGVTNRDLTLSGEAFFDVRKSSIPFRIHANGIQIKVLGTAFNVRSYPDDGTTETSLIRGRVEITLDRRPDVKYILSPNEKLLVNNDAINRLRPNETTKESPAVYSGLTHKDDSTIVETSWVRNKLIFDDETFEEIATKMERWFGVNITFEDTDLKQIRLTGTFTDESIEQAMHALMLTSRFRYRISENSVLIYH